MPRKRVELAGGPNLLHALELSIAWADERKRAAREHTDPPPRRRNAMPGRRAILPPPPPTPEDDDRRLGLEIYAAEVRAVLERAPREGNLVHLPAPLVDHVCRGLDYLLWLRRAA